MSDLLDPAVQPLWQGIRDRLITVGDLSRIKTVTVVLSDTGLARINGWLARTPRRTRLTRSNGRVAVPVQRILEALGPVADLTTILEQTVGIPDALQPRQRLATMKADFWSHAEAALPNAPLLIQHLRSGGLSDAVADDRLRLINALSRAHDIIPLDRPVPLPRLSLYCSGDPHYFDLNPPGRGGKLVLLVAELTGEALAPALAPNKRSSLLTRAGVYPDRLSSTVLTLNLTATGDSPVDDAIRAAAAHRRPLHLSLYDLTVHRPHICNTAPVTVVENPSVVEEALIRGYPHPLACTSGALSAVDHEFLQQLAHDEVAIRYSGDWDPPGRLIADVVRTRFGAHIITPTNAGRDLHADNTPVYQESHSYLEVILGPNPSDPLRNDQVGV